MTAPHVPHAVHGAAEGLPGPVARAAGLTERGEGVPGHCGAPMRWAGGHAHWDVVGDLVYEVSQARYRCPVCGARLTVELSEPNPDPVT